MHIKAVVQLKAVTASYSQPSTRKRLLARYARRLRDDASQALVSAGGQINTASDAPAGLGHPYYINPHYLAAFHRAGGAVAVPGPPVNNGM